MTLGTDSNHSLKMAIRTDFCL